jgi:hypothetical protein
VRNIYLLLVAAYNFLKRDYQTAYVNLTTTGLTILVQGISGRRIRVLKLIGTNAGALLTVLNYFDGTFTRFALTMAANGGGHTIDVNWLLDVNNDLSVQLTVASSSHVTVQYVME